MTQLSEGGRDRRSCNRLNTLTFAFTYLLIWGAACFLIRMQQLPNPISANWREVISKAFSTGRKPWAVMISTALLAGFGMGLLSGFISDRFFDVSTHRITKEAWMQTAVGRIIAVESNGDHNAKNNRSSAMGVGQFLDQTWLELIRAYRPDLMKGRSQVAILELRQDGTIAREITGIFMEKNATMLQKRDLPVTPATLYWPISLGPRALSLFCQHLRMPMRPPLWPAPTQLAERPARRLLRRIHSSEILRLLILGVGPIARCACPVPN